MKIIDLVKFVLAVLLMGASIALAVFDPVNDDTDIFLASPTNPAERPNVMIVMDNTANWNNAFDNEKSALVQVVNGLTGQFNLGLMLFPETGGGNDSVDGGYVRFHVRPMDLTNRTALASQLNNLDKLTDKGNNATIGLALHEAYLYYAGKTSIASHGKVKTDKDSTTEPFVSALTGNHALPAGTSPGLYRTPLADGCQRSFLIYISNGPANENATARADLEAKLGVLTGTSPPSVISITPNGMQSNWADEMAKFMANADVLATSGSIANSAGVQNVYTYVLEVDATTDGQGADMTALLKSVAANGKGQYYGVSSSALGTSIVEALNSILIDVQAVNSVFASTTLPVSVNVRGTNLNQVYIGVFRPDQNKSPRWLGNLKMYNLALNSATGAVYLADAANDPPLHASPPVIGNPAENTSTGFVSQSSPSFWTDTSTFWGFRDASQNGPGGPSDLPDGDLVEKGGAAQQLRIAFAGAEAASPARNLYTCTTGLVNGTNQDCVPNAGFQLSNTPFSFLNDAIDAGSLQLDSRFISPLTAYVSQPVYQITDRLPVQYFTNTFFGVYLETLNNGSQTATITNLTTAVPQTVTSLSALVANAQVVPLSSVAKASGVYRFQAAAALPSNYIALASVVISGVTGASGGFNGTFTISAVDTGNNRFTIVGGPSGNQTGTGGIGTVTTGTTTSTTAQATVPAHGFVSGQPVTILSASPTWFNGTYNVTVIDADHFNYTMTSAAGNASGAITASGNTMIATATTSAAHGFIVGNTVTVSGASDAAYNGVKTILSVPNTSTFTYSVGATAVGPNTNNSGVVAFRGGSTTVSVRIPDWWGYWCSTITGGAYPGSLLDNCGHGFTSGQSIYISGSDVSGYNGQFVVTVIDDRSFTYTTATELPANSSFNVYASTAVYDQIFGYAFNHNLKDGDRVAIENPDGPDAITGTYEILTVYQSDYYFYIDTAGLGLPPITKTNYTIRPIGGTNGVTGATGTAPQAYATVWSHGYPNGQEVRIDNASPAAYNGTHTIRVCDGTSESYLDRFGSTVTKLYCFSPYHDFSYPLASAPGANTNLGVTSSIKSTTARATSVNHGFANGSTVTVSGATPGDFNGAFVINSVDANTFTYTIGSLQGDATGTTVAVQTGGSSAERDLIVRWVRGQDNFSDENSNGQSDDIRASVHGDVLHSRPAVVNYNRFTGSDDDVFVYYGGNDGVFHAVRGGYAVPTGDVSGLTPGREAWGFIPQEFFGQFKRMRNNSPTISSAFKRPYFMDGPIGVLTQDNTVPPNGKLGDIVNIPSAAAQPASDVVNLYIANRRGGRFLYALDVNIPTDPKFLWKISDTTEVSSAFPFAELGLTWSQPVVVPNLSTLTTPVLVFGAGYDPAADDLDPAVVTAVDSTTGAITTTTVGTVNRTMGRGIYVVNALTGALIWSAGGPGSGATTEVPGMIYAIPSDVTVVRSVSGGAPSRAYVGDTGGNMWRIDFKQDTDPTVLAAAPNNLNLTTVTKLASISDQSTAAGRRKFLFPPDVVGQDGFDAILAGSGDREHPFDTTVTNRFYMFKDKGGDPTPVTGAVLCDPTITEGTQTADSSCTPVTTIAGMTDLTSNCLQDASACLSGETQANVSAKLGTDRGWFITLLAGEKVVGNAISIGGTTFFNTNQPSSTAGGGTCGSNLGVARQYQVATADATATSDLNAVGGLTGADRSLIHAGGGYLPSPVHVVVMLGGKPVEAVISGVQVSTPAGTTLSSRLRKYWYRELDVQ
jgi:Tfp pilus tip-associated adhesin PilY1